MKYINAILAGILIVGAAGLSWALEPRKLMVDSRRQIDYASAIPTSFGSWRMDPNIRLVVPVEPDSLSNQIYSQLVGRGYVDGRGNMIMLLIAYGPRQTDTLQLHRPEICYVAEGFRVVDSKPDHLSLSATGPDIEVRRMTAQREGRVERISYWMRVGDDLVSTLLARQATKIRYGLRGLVPDGALIRVSTINMDQQVARALHDQFLKDLLNAIDKNDLGYFIGSLGDPTGRAG